MTYQPGRYPAAYNPKVHGPYYPSRYYGKPDVPLGDVKIADLSSWFSRRSLSPSNMWGALHRGYYRWALKYFHVKVPGFVPFGHMMAALSTFYFFVRYNERSYHKHCKYH